MRLIDADELKKKFAYITHIRFTADMGQGGFEMFSEKEIEDIIDNAPTIPQPDFKEGYKQAIIDGKTNFSRPQGEWLSHYDYCEKHGYNPSVSIAFWWCDRCEQAVEHPTNFCPNCGADMRGKKNESGNKI